MPQMYCPDCRKNIKVGKYRGEQFCLDHPEARLSGKRSTKTQTPGRKGTVAYAQARTQFKNKVCGKRCFFTWTDDATGEQARPDHRCNLNRLEAHHIVGKSWIEGNYPDLDAAEFVAIAFSPLIGAPLCPAAHHLVTVNSDYIYRDELRLECIEFCEAVDAQWMGTLLPSGVQRQSMLERLYLESPERSEAVA